MATISAKPEAPISLEQSKERGRNSLAVDCEMLISVVKLRDIPGIVTASASRCHSPASSTPTITPGSSLSLMTNLVENRTTMLLSSYSPGCYDEARGPASYYDIVEPRPLQAKLIQCRHNVSE